MNFGEIIDGPRRHAGLFQRLEHGRARLARKHAGDRSHQHPLTPQLLKLGAELEIAAVDLPPAVWVEKVVVKKKDAKDEIVEQYHQLYKIDKAALNGLIESAIAYPGGLQPDQRLPTLDFIRFALEEAGIVHSAPSS